ncbi:SpoIIE family protein phosphatase [Planobispora takensis]|uniref:PAS domain-containing protein n=1 Tax=Planobispora takensis TaxID=1367882 RepID=A0A8J3WWJ4_9ACTN|nr:SpoIIE family protein phosphatase [Planobispora takensis]GII04916.1 hypothetical protein Pta02_69240 [Planobispora takensis]
MEDPLVARALFDHGSGAPSDARRFVAHTLTRWDVTEKIDDAVLLTSELVTNAVIHAGTGAEVVCRLDGGRTAVQVEVEDLHPARPVPDAPPQDLPPEDRVRGRGLALTRLISDSWGVTYTRTAKRVWFRLDLMRGGVAAGVRSAGAVPADLTAPLSTLRIAVAAVGPDRRVVHWDDAAHALLGWSAQEVLGRDFEDLIEWPDDHALSFGEALAVGRWQGWCAARDRSGRPVPLFVSHLRAEGVADGPRTVWLMVPRQHEYVLTAPAARPRRPAADELPGHRALQEVLADTGHIDALLGRVAEIVLGMADGDACHVLLPREETGRLGIAAVAGSARPSADLPSEGLFDTARASVRPFVLDDAQPGQTGLDGDFRSLVSVPLVTDERVVGFVVVTASRAGAFDDRVAAGLQRAAHRISAAVDRAQLAETERARRGWLTFLAEASDLLTGILDENLVAVLATQLLVPRIATWAAVYLVDDFDLRLAHAWHAEEEHNETLGTLLAKQSPPRAQGGWEWPAGLEGSGAVLVFPIAIGNTGIGRLVLGRRDADGLTGEIVRLTEDLCRRLALAVHIARQYSRVASTSHILQRSLMPVEMTEIPGVSCAVVYEPAGEGSEVGGDFYDVYAAGEDRWVFALGDVCGKGPEAAAVTGLARHALRLLARDGYGPAAILNRLNSLILEDDGRNRFLSMICGELRARPGGGVSCTLCCAGHPPPLMMLPEGTVRVPASSQLLVGLLDGEEFFEEGFDLEPGSTLLCVTDGVTERRSGGRLLDDGDGLTRMLSRCVSMPARAIAERLRQATLDFSPDPPQDDFALLILQAVTPRR